MQINPELKGKLSRVDSPTPFEGNNGTIRGWKVVIPGGRLLATPAVAEGRLFLGGGFGSYDFFALDAVTGDLAWQYQTNDDGPTAAVVAEGFVVFNTESCELEVLTVEGKPVWKKWLGDPLMSIPAVHNGRVYMAYPDSRGDHQHYLGCFDLRNGNQYWKQLLEGEIITAPVLADGQVYLATLGGALCCFREQDGQPVWQEQKNATSSPVVWKAECYFSQREEVPLKAAGQPFFQQTEKLAARGSAARGTTRAYQETARKADYLDHIKRRAGSASYKAAQAADAGVGFAGHKGDAKMEQAMKNLGHGTVAGIWAYQGSKPFIAGGRLYSALGDTLNCVDPKGDEVFWKKRLSKSPEEEDLLDSVVTPPVLVNGKIFLGTVLGEVCCLSAESGETLWNVEIGEPVIFQPTVVKGRVYASTSKGSLYCLETGDEKDDGWFMWGANAGHNGEVGK